MDSQFASRIFLTCVVEKTVLGRCLRIAVLNESDLVVRIGNIRILDVSGRSVAPLVPGPRLSHQSVNPRDLEIATLHFRSSAYLVSANVLVEVSTDQNSDPIELQARIVADVRPGQLAWHSIDGSLSLRTVHARPPRVDPDSRINGKPVKSTVASVLRLMTGEYLVCVNLESNEEIELGDRICAEVRFANQGVFVGMVKAFSHFACGLTQFDLIVRPVSVYGQEEVSIGVYNESDFRKSPAVLKSISLNGHDVTASCVLPESSIPPDRHRYAEDVRNVVMPRSLFKGTLSQHRLELQFKREEPQEPSDFIPADYFDSRKIAFGIDPEIPVPIDLDGVAGPLGGACVHYAGLRPLPALRQIRAAFEAVCERNPRVPVFASVPMLEHKESFLRSFSENDFTIVNDVTTRWNGGRCDDDFKGLNSLNSWALACLAPRNDSLSIDDLRWISWTAIGHGSHGVLLSASDGFGEEDTIRREGNLTSVLREVKSVRSLLEASCAVDLAVRSNQEGVRTHVLECGHGRLLLIAVNDWCSRNFENAAVPPRFDVRDGVILTTDLGANWKIGEGRDPITGESITIQKDIDGCCTVSLPPFTSVQLIELNQQKDLRPPLPSKNSIRELKDKSIEILGPSIVDLGKVRPGSKHTTQVSVLSQLEKQMKVHPVYAGSGSLASEVASSARWISATPTVLKKDKVSACEITLIAPVGHGHYWEEVQYVPVAGAGAFEMPSLLVCWEVAEPVFLSKTHLDFGEIAVGEISKTLAVDLKGIAGVATIHSVTYPEELPINVQVAAGRRGLLISMKDVEEPKKFRGSLRVSIEIPGQESLFNQEIVVLANWANMVTARPDRLVLTAQKVHRCRIQLRHRDNVPIKLESVVGSRPDIRIVTSAAGFVRTPYIEVVLNPGDDTPMNGEISVRGIDREGLRFQVKVPVARKAFDRR